MTQAMFLLSEPSENTIRRFLDSQVGCSVSYSAVGATAATPPHGFAVDHTRVQLAEGNSAFEAAKAALRQWRQFRLGWVRVSVPTDSIGPGQPIAVLAHVLGLWSLNACQIIYVVDELEPIARYGYAYGTLPEHAAVGEERFQVEWHRSDGTVWYDILAFSRPNRTMARLGYPYMRWKQKQFRRDSVAAMRRAVQTR
jgi:uncharacterized protein (UPF0548 family)